MVSGASGQMTDDRKQRTDEVSDGVKCCSDLSICLLSSDLCLLRPDTCLPCEARRAKKGHLKYSRVLLITCGTEHY